jgi:hypothetical protein
MRQFPPGSVAQIVSIRQSLKGEPVLFLNDLDRNFGTIGLGKPRLLFKSSGDGSVADFVRIAEPVEFEQFGRQRFAPGMTLALVLVDANLQLSGHFDSPCRCAHRGAFVISNDYSGAGGIHQHPNRALDRSLPRRDQMGRKRQIHSTRVNGIELITIAL